MADSQEKLSSLREVADRFQVSEKTIRRWFHSGQLEALILGRQLRFEEREIKRFMDLRRRARNKQVGATTQKPIRLKAS